LLRGIAFEAANTWRASPIQEIGFWMEVVWSEGLKENDCRKSEYSIYSSYDRSCLSAQHGDRPRPQKPDVEKQRNEIDANPLKDNDSAK
jgi:hypothetical protein